MRDVRRMGEGGDEKGRKTKPPRVFTEGVLRNRDVVLVIRGGHA